MKITPHTWVAPSANSLAVYDDSSNRRISFAEIHAHRIKPIRCGHPAYEYTNDGSGVVCEYKTQRHQ